MSDARWFEVGNDIEAAIHHFSMALRIHDGGTSWPDETQAYVNGMALMHAMQSGHTSLEQACLRVLDILGESPPTGMTWHLDLIVRLASPVLERPALLSPALAAASHETRRFRHLARQSYGPFDPSRATPAMAAAAELVAGLRAAVENFRAKVDP